MARMHKLILGFTRKTEIVLKSEGQVIARIGRHSDPGSNRVYIEAPRSITIDRELIEEKEKP